jgi:flagellar hook-basal body complex protein FliE
MDYLSINQVYGDSIPMKRTDPLHLDRQGTIPIEEKDNGTGFSAVFTDALNKVNTEQQGAAGLVQQMITDPESVDIHDITIALAKANTSLSITKSVVDSALKAYREIINIR